jgi:hypothetical protein
MAIATGDLTDNIISNKDSHGYLVVYEINLHDNTSELESHPPRIKEE